MKRIALHFPKTWKAALYGCLLLSWLTGAGWYSLHRWVRIEGEFGEEHSPWEQTLLKVHGAAAMIMMIYFGYLLASHVPTGWRSRRNRTAGIALLGALGFMIVTAYGLYYAGGESFREYLSLAHLIVGLSLPLLIGWHVWVGHSTSRTRKTDTKNRLTLPSSPSTGR